MDNVIIEINSEEYVKVEGLLNKICDYLTSWAGDGVSSTGDEYAGEVCDFLREYGREAQAVEFKKMYIMKRFGDVFGK